MTDHTISVAFDDAMMTGESPLWHAEHQCLYWVDIDGFAIHSLHPASGRHRKWPMASEPSTLARHANGGLVVALRAGFMHFDTEDGSLAPMVTAPYDKDTTRFNDGKVDAAGRFWVGTIYEPRTEAAAEMFCLERGTVSKVWSGGMTVSNGLAFSPDNRTLFHADTTSHTIARYDYDVATGALGERQVLRQFSMDKAHNYGGRPDGAAVDSEGYYWCAMYEGSRVLRLSPVTGEIVAEIALPVRCPTMVAFGGDDLRTLYITTAGKRPAEELAQYPLSGRVLQVQVDVAGLHSHAYQP